MRHFVLWMFALGMAVAAFGLIWGFGVAALPDEPLDVIESALRVGDYDMALAESSGLAALNPLDAEAQALHGLVLIRAGRFALAEEKLLLALGLDEACPEAHYGMGALARGRNLLERSAYHLVEASRAGRYRADSLVLLSAVRADGGDFAAALNAAELAESLAGDLDPVDAWVLRAKTAHYRAIGEEPSLLLPEAFQMTTADASSSSDGLPLLDVGIGDEMKLKLLFDSAFDGTLILGASSASGLELVTVPGTSAQYAGTEMMGSLLPSIRIGGLEIGRVPCMVADADSFAGGAEGIIGTGFLKRFNCVLDVRDGSLRLTRGERSDLLLRSINPARVAARALLYLAPEPIVLVSVNGGEHAPFLLSTAASRSAVDEAFIDGREVTSIEFGDFQIDDVELESIDAGPLGRAVGQRIAGVLGADVLGNYRVYFHFARSELILEGYEQ